jgi:hypothetical protein
MLVVVAVLVPFSSVPAGRMLVASVVGIAFATGPAIVRAHLVCRALGVFDGPVVGVLVRVCEACHELGVHLPLGVKVKREVPGARRCETLS